MHTRRRDVELQYKLKAGVTYEHPAWGQKFRYGWWCSNYLGSQQAHHMSLASKARGIFGGDINAVNIFDVAPPVQQSGHAGTGIKSSGGWK